jgi:hypothetical protein
MKFKAVLSPNLPGPIVALMNSVELAEFMLEKVPFRTQLVTMFRHQIHCCLVASTVTFTELKCG